MDNEQIPNPLTVWPNLNKMKTTVMPRFEGQTRDNRRVPLNEFQFPGTPSKSP